MAIAIHYLLAFLHILFPAKFFVGIWGHGPGFLELYKYLYMIVL